MCLWKIIDTFQKQNIYKTIDIFFYTRVQDLKLYLKRIDIAMAKCNFDSKNSAIKVYYIWKYLELIILILHYIGQYYIPT